MERKPRKPVGELSEDISLLGKARKAEKACEKALGSLSKPSEAASLLEKPEKAFEKACESPWRPSRISTKPDRGCLRGTCVHSYCGEALSRAPPLAQEPFLKHPRGETRSRASPLDQEPFSQHARTNGSRLWHSFLLRGSAFSSEPSRTEASYRSRS